MGIYGAPFRGPYIPHLLEQPASADILEVFQRWAVETCGFGSGGAHWRQRNGGNAEMAIGVNAMQFLRVDDGGLTGSFSVGQAVFGPQGLAGIWVALHYSGGVWNLYVQYDWNQKSVSDRWCLTDQTLPLRLSATLLHWLAGNGERMRIWLEAMPNRGNVPIVSARNVPGLSV